MVAGVEVDGAGVTPERSDVDGVTAADGEEAELVFDVPGRRSMVQVDPLLVALKRLRFMDWAFMTVLPMLMPPMLPSNTAAPSSRILMVKPPVEHSSPGCRSKPAVHGTESPRRSTGS